MHQLLISICIPVYNGERYIAETIESVIKQHYPNIEILVQDNASTDNTWSVLQTLAQQYPQLAIEQNEENYGMSGNWNLVINRAKGDYVMLLSADDQLMPSFIAGCLAVMENNDEIDAVVTNHFFLKDGELTKRKRLVQPKTYQNHSSVILLYNPFSINFTLFKKTSLDKMRRNGNLFRSLYTCDYDLSIRISLTEARVHYLAEYLGIYRVHESNLSGQLRKMIRQTVLVLLSQKKILKSKCPFTYRFTLLRQLARLFRHRVSGRFSDARLAHVLWLEFIAK
jgi:glycosyltransferase involved in cell wall biosynthesis